MVPQLTIANHGLESYASLVWRTMKLLSITEQVPRNGTVNCAGSVYGGFNLVMDVTPAFFLYTFNNEFVHCIQSYRHEAPTTDPQVRKKSIPENLYPAKHLLWDWTVGLCWHCWAKRLWILLVFFKLLDPSLLSPWKATTFQTPVRHGQAATRQTSVSCGVEGGWDVR